MNEIQVMTAEGVIEREWCTTHVLYVPILGSGSSVTVVGPPEVPVHTQYMVPSCDIGHVIWVMRYGSCDMGHVIWVMRYGSLRLTCTDSELVESTELVTRHH